ncbi:aldehyde dehydrogenase (NADP(+)) [Carboxylicivirga linearis]|uniref:Aldehyde dehydrogenase (NADP(+)) n=1 Tax=Carboxylicivirga linearis TaxID=1628157 RepID=A0ABS5JQI5_9BACT|nr:aldehyde dehydrogenase (NADP(+)) [Carboxylicivirga linearis]MBS2097085.1 aldehyde dehydrogenase (NADP(+)) [Carboxylicivirga linearis]
MKAIEESVHKVMMEAAEAFEVYKHISGKQKAQFLRNIGEEIVNLGDELIQTVIEETNLPEARVVGERGRTVGQLNKFADLVEEGSWKEAVIDIGDANREPLPKPDLRKMLIPMGPVVVFGAGNFPLAFSVAGGDTASALAAGNPVVVKGHPAHPKTSDLVASAIQKAIKKNDLPYGVFALVQDDGIESGKFLVQHPKAKAVGFTGSGNGGLALVKLASEREEPIPVFAEMGSVNPVVILENALKNNYSDIASKLVASVNMGAGQFCTNPGLLITIKTEGFNEFVDALSNNINEATGAQMFSPGVLRNYLVNADQVMSHETVTTIAKGDEVEPNVVRPAIATVSAADFMKNPHLHEEVFGPFSLLVVCDDTKEVKDVVASLKGQLTATLQAKDEELTKNQELIDLLVEKCGRLLLNGVPTGVEVGAAMQHGGPFPASSDSRFTSVGVGAIKRFVRPVCYQDFPDQLLPKELQNSNPLDVWRLVDNSWTKNAI